MTALTNRLVLLLGLPVMCVGVLISSLVAGVVMALCYLIGEGLPMWWQKYRDGVL